MKKKPLALFLPSALMIAASTATAAPIVWGGATTVANDSDILNAGALSYAYTMSNATTTVNGMTFTGSNSTTALGTNVTLAAATLTNNATAFGTGTGTPYSGLSAAYKNLLAGADYTNAATPITLTLTNLTAGHNYATQIWVNDNRSGIGQRTVAVTGGGGNAVTLDYNTTASNVAGGVGQYGIGFFNANAATQAFTVTANAGTSSQFNSLQVRDVTNLGYWTGTGGATWDAATTANFATNLFSNALTVSDFATAKAPLKAVVFGDAYWNSGATTAVTQNTVNIAAGGVSTGSVLFQNSGVNYTVNSSDALGITGSTILAVTGGGIVTLGGQHSYTGETVVANGTLKAGASNTFGGTGALNLSGATGVFDLNGSNASFTGLSGVSGGTVTDSSGSAGTSTLAFSNAGNTGVKITDGATRTVGLRVTNSNGGFFLTNGANSFSGGIVLTNSASGTRMSPGTIAAGAYGTGPITVGEAATDKAGIFFATAGQTLSNPIIANTGLGTDRVGTFRIAATGITLSGQLTAGLSDVTFSTNETGSVSATGKITGSNGLKLLSHTLSTSQNLTVTLNNGAGTNDYAGNTTINESASVGRIYTLALGAANQIPDGAGKGNVIINSNGTGVGRLNLGGFSETINGLSGNGIVDGVSGTPTFTVGGNDATSSFAGTIINTAGTLSLAKTGAGSLSLGGANSYGGATLVNGGKLFVNGSLSTASAVSVASNATFGGSGSAGAVSVANGGAIESGNGTAAGTLTVTALNLGSTAGDLSALNLRPYASPAVNVTGTDTLIPNGGAGTATINIVGAAPSVGTFTLIDYAGSPLSGAAYGAFALGTLPNRVTANLVDNAANTSVDLNVSLVDSARWSGALSSEWSTATLANPKNWVLNSDGTTTTDYLAGDTVSFTDSAVSTTVDVSVANVAPASVTFNNSTKDYTLQGTASVTGTTGITKTGTGRLTINNSNAFTGAVAIEQGAVSVGSVANGGASSPLGAGTSISLGAAATSGELEYTGATASTNRTASLGAGGGSVDVTNSLTNLTLAGVISGAGNLAKEGAGSLTLSGANNFTGTVNVNSGTMVAGNASAFGNAANIVNVAAGATLDINSQTLQGYTNNIQIAGTGATASLGALGNSNAADNLNSIRGITLTADAAIGGNGGRWDIGRLDFNTNPAITVDHITGNGFTLTKVGTGYLGLLTGAANLGGFVIEGGTVAPHENTSFGAGPVTMKPGTILQPWGGTTIANALNLEGGTIQTDGFQETFTGPVNVSGAATINTRASGNIVFNGNISGAGSFTKTGPFSFLMGGDNSGFTGTLTNTESNTFFTSATASSASAAYVVNAGNLANTTAGVVTQNLGALSGTGGQVGNNVAGGAVTYSIGALNTSTTFSGNIVDSVGGGGTTSLIKVGTGTLTLAGNNSYTGPTQVNGGELIVTGTLSGSAVTIGNGGILSGNGVVTTNNQNILLTAGSVLSPGTSPGNLTVNTGTGSLDISGAVAGSATAALDWEIDSTPALSDLVTLAGTLDIGSGVLEWDDFNFTPGSLSNGVITLIDTNSPITGSLGTTVSGSLGAGLEGVLSIGGSGTDLVLTVVPEPGSAALALAALAGLARRRRVS